MTSDVHSSTLAQSGEAGAVDRDALLRQTVATCWERSDFYRRRLTEAGVEPGDIQTIADLERVPVLLRKDDERELQEQSRAELGHPFGEHLCVDPAEVVAVSSTSGTTGTICAPMCSTARTSG